MPTHNKVALVRQTVEKAAENSEPMLAQIGIKPETFARVALNAALQNPEILNCSPKSIRTAFLACAQRGVLPDGEAASVVPYRNEAKLVMGYKGMADLVRRAIPGISFTTGVVCEDDEFNHSEGTNPRLDHTPSPDGDRPTERNIIAAYAVAWIPGNDRPEFCVLYKSELDHIRKTYTANRSPAWVKEYAEQAKKTAFRRLAKMLPTRSGLMSFGDEGPDPLQEVDTEVAEEPQAEAAPVDTAEPPKAKRTRKQKKQDPPPQEPEVIDEPADEPDDEPSDDEEGFDF